MKHRSTLSFVRAAIAIALLLSAYTTVELAWRVYSLGLAINAESRFPPLSAEAMSTKAAPLLQAATNADPIYSIVQSQHVELYQKHEFIIDLAESARTTGVIGVTCGAVVLVLLMLCYYRVSQLVAHETREGSHAENTA
jgi:hypothetical protein